MVTRGSAPDWEDLSGKWATDPTYGSKILQIFQSIQNTTVSNLFVDVQVTLWAYPSIERATSLGLLKGYENGEFRPSQPVSRAELAVVFERLYTLLHR